MKVLSIQSHVVHGYVGNRAATFPLQLLGYDVDVVNTVQFSNHTGYKTTAGTKTSPDELDRIFSGLTNNNLDTYDRILTGYIPGADALRVVEKAVTRLKPTLYLLDRKSPR